MPTKSPRAVFLVGFMGAGKTRVGRTLAERLGWQFLDLDDVVEERERRTIAQIFRESGEAAFRKAESSALQRLLDGLDLSTPVVVALGGGAAVPEKNAELLAAAGEPQVFLDAPFEVLRERCRACATMRPLFADEAVSRHLYEARRPYYLRAQLRIDTSSKSVEEIAAEIARSLQLKQVSAPGV